MLKETYSAVKNNATKDIAVKDCGDTDTNMETDIGTDIDKKDNTSLLVASSVINKEIEGLKVIEQEFRQDSDFTKNFIKLINLILNLKGRVILSGVGKSGHIANKISATLSSTGTPSMFIHPSEASHGDLGMITSEDIVILLSNSGETSEMRDIIYYCKRFCIPLVGFVRRRKSLLVEFADISFILPSIEEANDINAPTTSTTQMIVMGDALAVSLLEKRGFNNEDFAKFHPGGKLGANFLKIEDLMLRSYQDFPIAKIGDSMKTVIEIISNKLLGCCMLVDNSNKLLGIITDGDLRRAMVQSNGDIKSQKTENVMTKNPKAITSSSLAVEALRIMNAKEITVLPVVNNLEENIIIGVIHIHHLLRGGVS